MNLDVYIHLLNRLPKSIPNKSTSIDLRDIVSRNCTGTKLKKDRGYNICRSFRALQWSLTTYDSQLSKTVRHVNAVKTMLVLVSQTSDVSEKSQIPHDTVRNPKKEILESNKPEVQSPL